MLSKKRKMNKQKKLKIWIDITNSPHVLFFRDMIQQLQLQHEVIITCRPLANTIELLDLFGIDYTIIGKHYGSSSAKKVMGFFLRTIQLYYFLRKYRLSVSISHSSFYSPIVSKLLGVRCLYLNDNEHAEGNRISFLFADKILIPEYLSFKKVKKQWADLKKVAHYPGVKEGVYLWNFGRTLNERVSQDIKTIYIRPEPWTAQYYKGKKNFIDDLLLEIKHTFKIVLLPRSPEQSCHYQQASFQGVQVLNKSIDLEDIIKNCDLFIGAGGTMTREAAVLGIPTISIYQEKLLDVDNYLIQKGFMSHCLEPTANEIYEKLNEIKSGPASELLAKGQSAYNFIVSELLLDSVY